jgi:nucleotide-binding universal stress UspA family protein
MARITRILVPTDFSAPSDEALTYAKVLAKHFGASLHLVHAFEDPFSTAAVAAEAYTVAPPAMRQSETADAALDYAFLLAERLGASLQLLHVLDDPFVTEGLTAEAYITEAPAVRSAMLREAQTRLLRRAAPLRAEGAGEYTSAPVHVDTEVLFGHGREDDCGVRRTPRGRFDRDGDARTDGRRAPAARQRRRASRTHRAVSGPDRSAHRGANRTP